MAKYELTDMGKKIVDPTTKTIRVLRRIRACESFQTADGLEVVKDQLGGLIEKPENLNPDGYGWIGFEAMAYGDARITDDALLYGKCCSARDHALVGGQAVVYSSELSGNVVVEDKARVFNGCFLSGNVRVTDEARLDFFVRATGDATIRDCAHCTNGTEISNFAELSGHVFVQGGVIRNRAHLTGWANLRDTLVGDDARVDGLAFTDRVWVINGAHVGGAATLALGFKATKETVFLDGNHYGRKGLDSILLDLATALKDHPRIYRFIMGQIRGLSSNELVILSHPVAHSAASSRG